MGKKGKLPIFFMCLYSEYKITEHTPNNVGGIIS